MDPNSKLNEFGETLLMWACRNSQKELVEFLLSKGANLDIKDSDGETVLAYSESKPEILKLLVAGGLNPNSKDSDGTPILIKYINIGDTDLVRLLLEKGANIKYNPEELLLPALDRDEERLMQGFFGEVKIPQQANQGRQDEPGLAAVDRLDLVFNGQSRRLWVTRLTNRSRLSPQP